MMTRCGLLLLAVVSMRFGDVAAQQTPACYFGECDEGSTLATTRPPPVAVPVPAGRVPTAPEGRPGSEASAAGRLPPFLARNLCIYGAKAAPVKDAQTCMRLYLQPSATPKDGTPVDCGLIAYDPKGSVFTVRSQPVRTVGDCFGTTNAVPKSVRAATARCSLQFNEGFVHYRFDMDPARCKRRSLEWKAQIIS